MEIRELREKLNMTQVEFADKISATQGSVSRWELAHMSIDDKTIHPLFQTLMKKLLRNVSKTHAVS